VDKKAQIHNFQLKVIDHPRKVNDLQPTIHGQDKDSVETAKKLDTGKSCDNSTHRANATLRKTDVDHGTKNAIKGEHTSGQCHGCGVWVVVVRYKHWRLLPANREDQQTMTEMLTDNITCRRVAISKILRHILQVQKPNAIWVKKSQ